MWVHADEGKCLVSRLTWREAVRIHEERARADRRVDGPGVGEEQVPRTPGPWVYDDLTPKEKAAIRKVRWYQPSGERKGGDS